MSAETAPLPRSGKRLRLHEEDRKILLEALLTLYVKKMRHWQKNDQLLGKIDELAEALVRTNTGRRPSPTSYYDRGRVLADLKWLKHYVDATPKTCPSEGSCYYCTPRVREGVDS